VAASALLNAERVVLAVFGFFSKRPMPTDYSGGF